jgi:hypothetical protein
MALHIGAQIAQTQGSVDVFGIQGRQDDTVRHGTIIDSVGAREAD